ncbi:MAG: alpha/beta fold hydrolase [Candidatus Thorarchaeota archaeon]
MNNDVSSNYVEVNGLRLHYEEIGNGTPLILIHGGMLDANFSWKSYYPIFSQHFRVIATDSRGHGKSENPTKTFSYRLICDDIVALIKELELDRPLVIGYSDGGQAALEIGIEYPEVTRAIIAGGVLAEASEYYIECVKSWGANNPGDVDISKFEETFPEFLPILNEIHGAENWKNLFTSISNMWMDPDGFPGERVKKISVPTLILHGDRDEVIPLDDPLRIYRLIPNAELSIIPNADHMAVLSQIDVFSKIMLDFLKRNE